MTKENPSVARRRGGRRRAFALFVSLLGLSFALSGTPASQEAQKGERRTSGPRVVVNLAELARQEALSPPKREPKVAPFMPMPGPEPAVPPGVVIPLAEEPAGPPPEREPTVVLSPAPAASFAALGDNNTRIPPDTMGAVGPNHLMVTLNTEVRVQNRSGTALSTVSLESFWAPTGAVISFDPKLVYDPFGNRWIFSAVSSPASADSSVLIGASQTSDPTGSWNLYRIDADATDMNWADFPSLGFNKNWVVVSVNTFTNATDAFVGGEVYAFSKANLYAGAALGFTRFVVTGGAGATFGPAITYDNTLETMHLVQHWNGNFMGNGFLRLSTITGAVGSETLTEGTAFVQTPNPWAFGPPGFADFAPQKDTTAKIQNNDSRISNVVFRNGSLWTTQNAFLPASSPTRTAVQWWQFLANGTLQQFGRVDDSSGTLFYAFPSIAVNSQNDVLLGFSRFSANQFASGNYAFRASTDTPNTMQTDVTLKDGEATYFKTFSGTRNRWGDFSSTVVDPVNDLDMWTIQEYAASPVSGSDRWGTWWGKIEVATTPPAKKRRGQVISE